MTRGTPVKAILHASIRTSRPAPIHGCGPTRSQGQRSPDRNTRARVPKRAAQVERRVTVEPTGARNQAKASLVRDFEWSLSRETISREPRRLADSLHHLPTPTACAGYRGRCTGGRLVVVGRERGIEPHGLPAAVPEVEVVVVVALSAGCFAASLRKGHRPCKAGRRRDGRARIQRLWNGQQPAGAFVSRTRRRCRQTQVEADEARFIRDGDRSR